MSQNKFATYLHIPAANIAKWEQGVSKPPEYVVDLIERVLKLENLI
jgi:DNA-binding transcriptional regulator YiaG